MKQGQILILVLLVVVVILAIGLSVASRNITNLRTSTQTEQSQRAFSAAEGGVEDVLTNLEDIGSAIASGNTIPQNLKCSRIDIDSANCGRDIGGLKANVVVEASNIYEQPIALGNVAQIDLSGYGGTDVKVEWAIAGDQVEVLANGSAAVEISLVHGSAPDYDIERWYFQGINVPLGSRDEQFPGSNPAGVSSACIPNGFEHCVEVNLTSFGFPQVLRIRPFFTKTTARVAGLDGNDLPSQIYDISSTATTDIGVTRKVQVQRSKLRQVPAVFDFALYSETDITK